MEVGVIVTSISSDSKIATRALLSSLYSELLFVAEGVWVFDNIGVVDSKGGGPVSVGFLAVCGLFQRWGRFPCLSLPGR